MRGGGEGGTLKTSSCKNDSLLHMRRNNRKVHEKTQMLCGVEVAGMRCQNDFKQIIKKNKKCLNARIYFHSMMGDVGVVRGGGEGGTLKQQ